MAAKSKIKKPNYQAAAAFAGGSTEKTTVKSGKVPTDDVRLTANIRQDLHLRLKIAAAKRQTTMGEIIEEMIERNLD